MSQHRMNGIFVVDRTQLNQLASLDNFLLIKLCGAGGDARMFKIQSSCNNKTWC